MRLSNFNHFLRFFFGFGVDNSDLGTCTSFRARSSNALNPLGFFGFIGLLAGAWIADRANVVTVFALDWDSAANCPHKLAVAGMTGN